MSQKALEYAVQIVIAKMQNANVSITGDRGKDVADFLEVIYKKISKLESQENQSTKD